MLQRTERSLDAPSEAVDFLNLFRMELVFGKVCYEVLIGAVPDGKTQERRDISYSPYPPPGGK